MVWFMVYYNKGIVKRYIRKIKNKSKNIEPYRTTETVNIGLSKTSEFKDNENIIVIRLYEDFKKLTSNLVDIENKDKNS